MTPEPEEPAEDEQASPILALAVKELSQYTSEDLSLILTSSVEELCDAFGLDVTEQPDSGMLLPGATMAGPVIFLSSGVVITTPLQQGQDTIAVPDALPYRLYLYGEAGTATPFDSFTFGMALDENAYMAQDSTYRIFEAGDDLPSKFVSFTQDGLDVSLYFEESLSTGELVLEVVEVELAAGISDAGLQIAENSVQAAFGLRHIITIQAIRY